jgi:acylphosphatase
MKGERINTGGRGRRALLLVAAACAAFGAARGARGADAAAAARTATATTRPTTRPAPATRPAPRADEGIRADTDAYRVTLPAVVAKQGTQPRLKGAIEYLLVSRGGKEYEALFTTDHAPEAIRQALVRIGLRGWRPGTEQRPPQGKPVRLFVEYASGETVVRRAADGFMLRIKTGERVDAADWTYTGSIQTTDPATGKRVRAAGLTKSVVGLHRSDASPLVQNARPESRRENIYKADVEALPPAGTVVRFVFQRPIAKVPEGTKRVHVFISGRVQGVGFRAFTQRNALMLKVSGWVRNLRDGRVEAEMEGPAERVDELLKRVRRGPRSARVTEVVAESVLPEGGGKRFEVRY